MRGGLAAEDWSTFYPSRTAWLRLAGRLVRKRRDPHRLQDRLDDRKIDPLVEGYLPQILVVRTLVGRLDRVVELVLVEAAIHAPAVFESLRQRLEVGLGNVGARDDHRVDPQLGIV